MIVLDRMSRQFLIPWILIAKITIVKTQPPQVVYLKTLLFELNYCF